MKRVAFCFAFFLLCFGMSARGLHAQGTACCSITAIDAHTGIVSAKVNSSDEVFQFKLVDKREFARLRVGQQVYANFNSNQVSLDGKTSCCSIISRSEAPIAIPQSRRVSPPENSQQRSMPRNQSSAVQVLKKDIASPINVRTTQSLDDCRSHSNGNGIGCAAAMDNRWYILVWDWNGRDADIDGFNVYQDVTVSSSIRTIDTQFSGGNNAPGAMRGPVTQFAQKPIQTNFQHPLMKVAVLDPKNVGTSACFSVTAYSGGTESARSSQMCLTAASASAPVFKSVTLTPTRMDFFWGFHRDTQTQVSCGNFQYPAYPLGTGVASQIKPAPANGGTVMSMAYWNAGAEPLPCQEFLTQATRLGAAFEFPPDVNQKVDPQTDSDIAQIQSATLLTNLQFYTNSLNASTPCVTSVWQESGAINAFVSNLNPAGFQPPQGSVPAELGGESGWVPNRWIYPLRPLLNNGSFAYSPTPYPPVGRFAWPPQNGEYSADVSSAVVKCSSGNNCGVGFVIQSDQDEIGSDSGGSTFQHQGRNLCEYTFSNIRLRLNYMPRTGP